eukprot:CAMPEP_0198284364 /NCGR_PEP_ID=MMETSP1449-20131203/3836_1 /TAXON_ID=420275 /ORGANISM="Attheya septentrionalis, Strain CCMP2084" /LENGTH=341 /DNA_ID=CAMNT_0043981393 /DNA_START=108 /DNA_END=1133 /DNA_ORIENTATION=+
MGGNSSKPRTVATKWYADFVKKELPPSLLEHQVVAITGCTTGTGLVAAKTAASQGAATVLLLNRESERATAAHAAVEQAAKDSGSKTIVETIPCDLQSFESVKAAAATIQSKYKEIDVLCNNAGVMALDDYATVDGYDVQMQTNHLSHFLLTKELFPLLTKAAEVRGQARIVNHSSMARKGSLLEAKYFGKNGGNLGGNKASMMQGAKWDRYHQTKLANVVFTLALKDKLEAANSKVISTVAAPGYSLTNLQLTTNKTGGMSGGMWTMRFAQSGEDGTMPLLSACFLPSKSGDFYEPSGKANMTGPAKMYDVTKEKSCNDEASRKMLWETSEEACGKFDIA